jgi:hypothetical protein
MGFCIAHWLLHLIPNLDTFPEQHRAATTAASFPPTDTFIFAREFGTLRLSDYFDVQVRQGLSSLLISDAFPKRARSKEPLFQLDEQGMAYVPPKPKTKVTPRLTYREQWLENQAPFAFLTAVVDRQSMRRLTQKNGTSHSRELASLCTRIAFSNSNLLEEHKQFSKDALFTLPRYDRKERRLLNLCRDDRLFAAFSRRGAAAVIADPGELPALFYIPCLLNLFEILRARLYGAVTTGSLLSRMAAKLSVLDTNRADPLNESEYAELHRKVVANLQDPLQYLFDGGSLTDLANEANQALFVADSWANVRQAFAALDRLLTTWETVRFKRRYGDPDES